MVDQAGEIKLPVTNDLIEPDLMVLRDEASLPDLESTRPLDHVLLVAEVVTHPSIREDREMKPRSCALAGVPIYLLIDRFTIPMTVSQFSEPGEKGYARVETVNAGANLRLPEPFDVTLDTASLPSPRRGASPVSDTTRYVLFYENGENFAAVREHFPAHQARWQGFMDAGTLLSVGPFTDGDGGAMAVFTTREAAEEFANGDPFVLNQVVGKWHVRQWRAVTPD